MTGTIIHFFTLAALCAVWIMGVHAITRADKILGFLDQSETERNWLRIICKPLWDCPTCMASVHGTLWWWLAYDWPLWSWLGFPILVAGFVEVFVGLADWRK